MVLILELLLESEITEQLSLYRDLSKMFFFSVFFFQPIACLNLQKILESVSFFIIINITIKQPVKQVLWENIKEVA